jgi:hypothetical protein
VIDPPSLSSRLVTTQREMGSGARTMVVDVKHGVSVEDINNATMSWEIGCKSGAGPS